jgi:hypothetical protein
MNERIKELEDQASQYASRETTDLDEWEFIFRKKFAELIVRECCFVGEQYAEGLFDMKHYDFVNKKIKEHFGVE